MKTRKVITIDLEMYLQDDWSGILHCNVCDKVTKRYIPVSEYREQQINKILQ
jgi:hypothetical protein